MVQKIKLKDLFINSCSASFTFFFFKGGSTQSDQSSLCPLCKAKSPILQVYSKDCDHDMYAYLRLPCMSISFEGFARPWFILFSVLYHQQNVEISCSIMFSVLLPKFYICLLNVYFIDRK